MAKYSLCIEAVLNDEVDFYDRIQVAKDLGFDAVEFWDTADKDVAKIAKLSAQHNIPVAICCVKMLNFLDTTSFYLLFFERFLR